MRRKLLALSLFLGALAATGSARAQSAHWSPPGGSLPVGAVSALELEFDDCSPDDTPVPPRVDGLKLEAQGHSTSISLINGTYSNNVTITFVALLSQPQGVVIPAFTVKTNKGNVTVPETRFSAANATVGQSGVALSDAAAATLAPSSDSVWAGEVFDLTYTIDVSSTYNPSWGRATIEWDPSPLVAEDWSQPSGYQTGGGSPRTGLTYKTRALAPSAGRIRLNPTSQLINLSVGVTGFGFFQQRQYQQFAVPDSPVSIDVRPLPPAPANFTGAVGDFQLDSKVVPAHVKVGEPVTWTIELKGTGNWPEIHGLPSREAPAQFQVIQPKPKLDQPQGKLFEGTYSEDVVLVPTQEGTYELPEFSVAYFDPRSGTYRTITAPGGTVIADPVAAAAPAALAPVAGAPSISASAPTTSARAPERPTGGLGDPLALADPAPAPLSPPGAAAACAAPFAALAALWIGLAVRRARLTDPIRSERQARVRLSATVAALAADPGRADAAGILAWQRDAALLWGIRHSAPPAAAFPEAPWPELWAESDRFLYSEGSKLPADWVARAREALSAKRLPAFRLSRALLPRNLLPLAVLLIAAIPHAHAADPGGAYRKGDFSSAEKGWSSAVAAEPLDWTSRHNLSLALSQQDRWGEAEAEAAAAFVQHPSPETRRQLVVAGDKAGFIPEPLDLLIQPGPLEALARLQSPASWQRTLAGSAAAAAAALALLLLLLYRIVRGRGALALALALLLAALLAGIASMVAHGAYGIAADPGAVVAWRGGTLRSIPTEADVSQKTTVLSAGSTAVAGRTFLDWVRLTFPNGQTGWVLQGEVTYLWKAPPT